MASAGALDGIVVLDLSRVLAGPYCTMGLADLGATVWKIEDPKGGDGTRGWAPPTFGGTSTYYLSINRNKRSLAIDLKSPDGARLVQELAKQADVVVSNFLPGVLERFGLDFPTLQKTNPGLIHCAISGYGGTGARAPEAGYDFVIQAESGLMSLTGEVDGAPLKMGIAISDILAGASALQAILAALFARTRTGRGQTIDISLLDCSVAALSSVASGALNANRGMERYGNAHASVVPYQSFATADGNIVVAVGSDRQYRDFCAHVLVRADLGDDPRFRENTGRVEHRVELIAAVSAVLRALPTATIAARAKKANVPTGEVRDVLTALAAPEVEERGMIATFDTEHGPLRIAASPLALSDAPPTMRSAPPKLGEHSRVVLSEALGLSASALDDLVSRKVIAVP